jgi:transposase
MTPLGDRRTPAAAATPAAQRRPTPHHPRSQLPAAIVYMARTSTPWRLLPAKELGCGSPATAWRRLAEWARAGVFEHALTCSKRL